MFSVDDVISLVCRLKVIGQFGHDGTYGLMVSFIHWTEVL